ncbi:UNVERIFIED_CONTAM: hypothetical protein Sradi_2337000 [Sesamum radiatum]|uniref:Reverse transcriptase domain-containing protein n=1 Tax=Sesamum radiatum TaxID=300843 RepID=A0AAW2T6H5_SESRA
MLCVTTVSHSFLLNGEEFGLVKPGRGLRHGVSLSLYLFLFCAEVLSLLVSQAKQKGEIHGVSISRHAPLVSHLLLADDTLIFSQASVDAMACIKRIGDNGACLGSENKFRQIFHGVKNVTQSSKEHLAAILGVAIEDKPAKYLGLPTVVGRSKREVFDGIKIEFGVKKCTAPSFTWCSLLHSRDLLVAGFQWRVGKGQSMTLKGVPWLPRPDTFQLIFQSRTLPGDAKVADLINAQIE